MNGCKEPRKYINIQTDKKKHEATGNHKKFHHPCINFLGIFFFTTVKEKRFRCHPECLDHDGNKNCQPVNISENSQLMFGFLLRQVHHMLVDEPAEHIINHSAHTHYY